MTNLSNQLLAVQEALEIAKLYPIRYPHDGAVKVIQAIDEARASLPAIIKAVGELEAEAVPDNVLPISPDEDAVNKALNALDEMADAWAKAVNLSAMIATIVTGSDPLHPIQTLVRQAYCEGLYEGRFSHAVNPAIESKP